MKVPEIIHSTPTSLARQEGCNLFQRNANAPVFASLVRGTTRWPIVFYLPEVRSLFPIDVWRDTLRTHPDCDFVKGIITRH